MEGILKNFTFLNIIENSEKWEGLISSVDEEWRA